MEEGTRQTEWKMHQKWRDNYLNCIRMTEQQWCQTLPKAVPVGQPTGFHLLSLCDTIPGGIKDFVTSWDPSSWYLYSYDGNLLGLVIHLYDHFFFQNINDQPEMEQEAIPSPQEQQKWPGGASGNLLICPTYPPWNKYQMLMDFYLC